MKFIKTSFIVTSILAVSGCGYIYGDNGLIKSQKYEYLVAKEGKDLEMPAPLKHKNMSNYTVVPSIGNSAQSAPIGKELPQGAPIQLLAVLDNTRVDKQSSIPAVLVMDNVDFVWQTVTQFFKKHKIKISNIDEQNKTFVTAWIPIEEGGIWLGLDGSDEAELFRAKYTVSISNSNLPNEYRLTVERTQSESRTDEDLPWQPLRITWQESADMMNLILSHYDGRVRQQEADRQLKIMAGFKIELGQNSESEPSLLSNADEKLIWEKIPKVMRELGMVILEKDEKQKTYFMEYKTKQDGFFASLFKSEKTVNLFQEGAYQISVGKVGETNTLTFRDGQGVALESSKLVAAFPELSRLFGDRR